jgi:glycosyltransferase involved in cell wall biosynthesis
MKNEKPLVSVCCITYNHEKFISQAIDGFLMQKTDFPVEIIIGEDCSTDNTRAICRDYKEKYPDRITLLLPEKNHGMNQNFIKTVQACTGKYIALCEGDDYWTDPLKLQKQVDFLEVNEDFAICFHPVKVKNEVENTIVDDFITPEMQEVTDIYDLAKGNYMHTPSVVFRKNQKVFDTFNSVKFEIGDYPLHILNAQYGKIERLKDTMAVYRRHLGGVMSMQPHYQNMTRWYFLLIQLQRLFINDHQILRSLEEQYCHTSYKLYKYYSENSDTKQAICFFTEVCKFPEYLYARIEIEAEQLRKSYSYRLGRILLKPLSFLKKFL